MIRYQRVFLSSGGADDVMVNGAYVDVNGALILFDESRVHPCDVYDQIELKAEVIYAPGVWKKVVAVHVTEGQ